MLPKGRGGDFRHKGVYTSSSQRQARDIVRRGNLPRESNLTGECDHDRDARHRQALLGCDKTSERHSTGSEVQDGYQNQTTNG